MATNVQRVSAILDALVDGTADPTVLAKVGDAYGYTYERGEVLTNQQKSGRLSARITSRCQRHRERRHPQPSGSSSSRRRRQ